LYRQIRHNTENSKPTSRYITAEKTRNRVTTRTTEVFHDLTGISSEWVGLESLIKIERIGTRAGKPYHQVAYYISSKVCSATDFAKGIRGHWGIENRLHWVKDVIFDEDHSTIRMGNEESKSVGDANDAFGKASPTHLIFCVEMVIPPSPKPKDLFLMILTNSYSLWVETALPFLRGAKSLLKSPFLRGI
jgi:hypothetical protein